MNQPLSRPAATLAPPCGERAGRGETRRGSWPQLTSNFLEVFPLHELRSSRRKEAHFSNAEWGVRNAELSQGLVTSAATTIGSCRNVRGGRGPSRCSPCLSRS